MEQKKREEIASLLRDVLRKKLAKYKPETNAMPFHTRLLGRDRMALFSFIHSLNTVFGTSIFEQVAAVLARGRFRRVELQKVVGKEIAPEAQHRITELMNDLKAALREPSWQDEFKQLRTCVLSNELVETRLPKVDVWLEDKHGDIFLFDIKTAKPNKGSFEEYKRTLLEWMAVTMMSFPEARVRALVAIPYNPYEPAPYARWTLRGMLDLKEQLMVGREFWDFLGGEGVFDVLLDVFEAVGQEMRDEINDAFERMR